MFAPIIAAVVLAFVSAIIHALGLLMLLYWQTRQWPKIEANFSPRRNLQLFLALIGVILVLHVLEIGVWAGCYVWQHCLPDFETSFYFSGATYTTLGYGDVVLPRPWRLAGQFEPRWFDPKDGARGKKPTAQGGRPEKFTAPDGNDWALFLRHHPAP
jgi:hypothetical protein